MSHRAEAAAHRNGTGYPSRFDRLELKFVADSGVRERMLPVLRERLQTDAHGDRAGSYRVATVYYDNEDRDVYWERARGLTPRHKLRLRRYGPEVPESGPVFVEIKTRLRRRVVKRRIRLPLGEALDLCAGTVPSGHLEPQDELLVDDIVRSVESRHLVPACLVRYERQAFVGADGLRVTFDSDLTYRTDGADRIAAPAMDRAFLGPDRCVLEVKVTQVVPHWLTLLVARSGGTLRRFSKYCRAVEVAGVVSPRQPPAWVTAGARPAFKSGELWTPSPGS